MAGSKMQNAKCKMQSGAIRYLVRRAFYILQLSRVAHAVAPGTH
jgi:hypothetical protein